MKYLENEKFKLCMVHLETGHIQDYLLRKVGELLNTWEQKFYNPDGFPFYDYDRSAHHPKVQELRELSLWSEGQVWSSPELHENAGR